MVAAVVAVLTVGFVGGPSSDVLTDVRPTNHWLIIGTWELRREDGLIIVTEFRRNGQITSAIRLSDGNWVTLLGTYRIQGQRLEIRWAGGGNPPALDIVRLDRSVLVVGWQLTEGKDRYRRQ
jgi:uncharacterized protein (TIGR03066 family)